MTRLRFWLTLALIGLGLGSARAEAPPLLAIGIHSPVLRDIPRGDAEVILRYWVDELAQSIKLAHKPIRFYDSLEEMKRDVDTGELNFIAASSMGMAQHFSPEQLSDGLTGYKNSADNLLLVVRRAANIGKFSDLSGRRLSLLNQDELSDIYLQTLMMKTWSKADDGRFASIAREQRSSTLVHRLFFDKTDAALIYRNSYEAALALNPQIEQQLRALDDYPCSSFFSSKLGREHREAITTAAIKLSETARGRQILEIYKSESLVVSTGQELEPFRELLVSYRRLKASTERTAKNGRNTGQR